MEIPVLRAAALIDAQVQSNYHIVHSIQHAYPLHSHDFYELFLVTSGRCIHRINGEEQPLETGAMAFVRPGDTHGYDYWGHEDCQFMNVNYYPEIVENAFAYFGNPGFAQKLKEGRKSPVVRLVSSDLEALSHKGRQMHLYTTTDKPKARTAARSLLTEALANFYYDYRDESGRTLPEWLDPLLIEMQKKENFTAGLGRLNELADRSVSHLNRIFKQYLQTTPTAYINQLRLSYARNLLLTTRLSILEVSLEAGFDNLSHFYHLFKKCYGLSPGKIRSG
ncbi:AraC family transcriptional regulator [Paenibacillus yonginensis]|uniref:AraC family transcriptional regulator n=1 Tax=Paenibacillus yonginensis TaxID=1462996 RepID=A0A1B1N2F2_9BACL|nr:AraC family transcriptional regulator [Paenibacillus yonginensis]ANS75586.1 AraC family transcriptional regulator [Paenibacillus yonginensis]